MSLRSPPVLALLLMSLLAPYAVAQDASDPYIWLEDWTGPRVMQWVEAENARTVSRLQADPRYAGFYASALAIRAAEDRIPTPTLHNGRVFNLWRDRAHPQGIWRYTTRAQFATAQPQWQTLLDLDALSKSEGRKWVWKGADCLDPVERYCLLKLSDGGEDAVSVREFDLQDGNFVGGGFWLGRSKQDVAWADADTLLVARDWGAGSMTASGYPFVVKRLARRQPLSQAREVFRGTAQDVGVAPFVLNDGSGQRAMFISRATTFFESQIYLVGDGRVLRVPLPARNSIEGMVDGQVLVQIREDWVASGVKVPAGAVVSIALADIRDGGALHPTVLFAPSPRQSVNDVTATKSRVVLSINDNVRGRALVFARSGAGWIPQPVALSDNASIDVAASSTLDDQIYLQVTGFLEPTTLWSMDAADPRPVKVKGLPPRFDASRHVVEQFEAVSTDGTKIPYFIVHRRDIPLDGSTPTLMTAYGGFEVAETPYYDATTGKLWLEQGGSFVLANIRGGGEFGPAWHEAGRKTRRQVIYDDFASVARDLFTRRFTSTAKLGIFGGSNGGLLMGVEFNQHPELWRAVAIQVPLLDMIRYEQIAAGASWVDEYGSVTVPAERTFLEKISPYRNIRKGGAYPEPYIWTTTKDDRVGPQHARKFAARLKEYGLPYLFFEDTAGGHSGDADVEQRARLDSMQMVYFAQKLLGP